ncbi:hemerythrin domain-containing protein [Pseudorhizobium endolithicum]|uniref:Hemerythrin domain-containing protein n=1 Tax=Pseudorhizobium endolithicum TaxID=1191678 RepID=A0ABN7JHD9_9HYPH|nr:hemerythrin domain-containing protein [Pseudorhizobium endolithicum]CAD7031489.1 hemerythrin domain-containing protein [Pseudorhizobium endolithicum]
MAILQPLSARYLATLEMNHQALLDLCLKLEELSASSSEEIEAATCDRLEADLLPLLRQTQQLEEQALFEQFAAATESTFGTHFTQELKAEHRCDLAAAADALAVLRSIRNDTAAIEPARHLLRGFAESLRRHINSEKLVIEALLSSEAEKRPIFS